jgi:hypothetical protein
VKIISGQNSSKLVVNWGCEEGEVICNVTGTCETYEFSKQISLKTTINGPMFVEENETNVLFHIDSLEESTLTWTPPEDATVINGQGSDTIIVNWGNTFEDVVLSITNSCGTVSHTISLIKKGQYPFPDIYTPNKIPGEIIATNFDYGGEGIAYHDLTAGNNGNGPRQDSNIDTEISNGGISNIGWIRAGEWVEYTIDVDSTSEYEISVIVASDNSSGGTFSMNFNETELITDIGVAFTGGWYTYKTVIADTVTLTENDSIMRFIFNKGEYNLNKIIFKALEKPEPVSTIVDSFSESLNIYPIPAKDYLTLTGIESIESIEILDINGRVLQQFANISRESKVTLGLTDLSQGIFFLKVIDKQGKEKFEKFIKVNR